MAKVSRNGKRGASLSLLTLKKLRELFLIGAFILGENTIGPYSQTRVMKAVSNVISIKLQ